MTLALLALVLLQSLVVLWLVLRVRFLIVTAAAMANVLVAHCELIAVALDREEGDE